MRDAPNRRPSRPRRAPARNPRAPAADTASCVDGVAIRDANRGFPAGDLTPSADQSAESSTERRKILSQRHFETVRPRDATGALRSDTGVFVPTEF